MDGNTQQNEDTAGRFSQLEAHRKPFLDRARSCSELTLPTLIPPEGSNNHTLYEDPYQNMGSRGVNNLSSKLLLALMPPNAPFFKLTIDDYVMEQLGQTEGMKTQAEEALGKIERSLMQEIEGKQIRVICGEALKQLIVGGNGLLYLDDDNSTRLFPLSSYVVFRLPNDDLVELIVKESVSIDALPEEMHAELKAESKGSPEKTFDLYTHAKLEGSKWKIKQTVNSMIVPKSEGEKSKEDFPWLPLRWIKVPNEPYGRGLVEENYGNLRSLEDLTKSIVEGTAGASKTVWLVNPQGVTSEKVLTGTQNNDVRSGRVEDIGTVQSGKSTDYRVANDVRKELKEELAAAFLLQSSIQRNAERVTAEEIRYMAGELEDALGGVYSVLSQEFQLPLIKLVMRQMTAKKRIPKLPDKTVAPTITTGLEALGRGHDLQKLDLFMQGSLQALGPEALGQYINVPDYLSRRATALGISTAGLVRTQEEIKQEQQAAMEAQQQQEMTGLAASGGMDILKDSIKQ